MSRILLHTVTEGVGWAEASVAIRRCGTGSKNRGEVPTSSLAGNVTFPGDSEGKINRSSPLGDLPTSTAPGSEVMERR
jgi:hypothetical protein